MTKGKEVHFGQLAIVLGYVTPASVAQCLKLQKVLRERGEKKQLGEILVEQQVLTEDQFKNILMRQGIERLRCPKCELEHPIEEVTGAQLFQCEKCQGRVVAVAKEPDPALKVSGEDPIVGQVLAGTRIVSRLHDDDYTLIYRGIQEDHKREVLVRVLKDELGVDPDKVRKFMTRAAKAAKVKHASVASIYNVEEEKGLYYTVEEKVDGTSLTRLLVEEKNLPPRQVVKIALQIAQGLKSTHARKAVHGNVSIENIMINRKGRAVLINLSVGPTLLSAEEALGKAALTSPEFAAPEAIKDASRATPRSDIFSLGAVIYRMIVGAGPFTGETDFETMLNNLQGKHKRLNEAAPALPERLVVMVEKMLKRNPMMRYQNMGHVVEDFEKLDVTEIPKSKLPVPKDMIAPRAPELPALEKEALPVTPKEADKPAPEPVPEPVPPPEPEMAPPPEPEPPTPEKPKLISTPDEEEEPLKLAKEEPVPDKPEPPPLEPAEMPEEEIEVVDIDEPAEPEVPSKKLDKRSDLPEVAAFLEDEPDAIELTQKEKQEILEEELAQEQQQVMPPPEVIEAMAKAGKKKGKPLPIIVAAVAVVVLVIIFILVMSIPGGKTEPEITPAEKRYNELIEFASENAGKHKELIKKFRAYMKKYPNTRWATKARVKVADLEKQMEESRTEEKWTETLKQLNENATDVALQVKILKEYVQANPSSPYLEEANRRITQIQSEALREQAQASIAQMRKEVDELCDKGKFKEALKIIDAGPAGELPKELYETRLHRMKNTIYSKAREAFEKINTQAANLARSGKVAQATALLESVIKDFGIEDYTLKARKTRADILNAQFAREQLSIAAYYGAVQAATDTAGEGNYDTAIAVLKSILSDYPLAGEWKDKVNQRVRWVEAARNFLQSAYDQLTASVGKVISLRSSSGIAYQGTLKKFEKGMLTIGELPPFAISELPRSEIVRLARKQAGTSSEQSRFEEAAYHYFGGDPGEARELIGESRGAGNGAGALAAELTRIAVASNLSRNLRLFDTRTLKGWKGDTKLWKVEGGLLVASSGQLEINNAPKAGYTFTFHVRRTSSIGSVDVQFPVGGTLLTWHLGSEEEEYSEVKGVPTTRSSAVLLESVWVRVTLSVSQTSAEARMGDKIVWKLDPVPELPDGEPALGFSVNGGTFEFDKVFLREAK